MRMLRRLISSAALAALVLAGLVLAGTSLVASAQTLKIGVFDAQDHRAAMFSG